MGRMHCPGKGISKSALPYKRSPPSWLKVTAAQVEEHVCKLAKKGLTPSQVRYYYPSLDVFSCAFLSKCMRVLFVTVLYINVFNVWHVLFV